MEEAPREVRPKGRHRHGALLKAVTERIVDVYNSCHEEYVYSTTSNPKRTLTWPSEGLHNGGLDNSEHNYIGHVGDEILNQETGKSYELLESLGQGSFGQVLKCQVDQRLVALKIIKNRPSYFNQGCIEANVLKRLNSCFDPEDQYHIVRMLDCFVFKKHLCIAFELLELNLLEFLKWNSYKGFALPTIQSVTRQLLEAMICVVQASLIHCDLKPENVMVVSMTPIRIKLIDFGSACTESCPRHAYIQSRFYRSPEVILGLPYGSAIDIWSLGCIVAELLLGLPLFPGQCEYDQLRCIVKIMGLPPKEMLSAGSKSKRYFKRVDEAFVSTEEGRGGEECCEGPAEQVTTISTVASTATTADTELTVQVEVEVELEGSQANPQGPAQMDVWKEADHEQRATQMLQVQEPRRTTSWRLKTGDEYENDSNKKAARSRRAWPFTSIEEVVKDVPEENRGCLLQFLMGLFQMDPNGRWTARQALQHPFINEDAPFSEGFRPPQELRPGAAGLQGLSPNVNVNCRRAKPAPSSTTGTPASSPNHSSTGSVLSARQTGVSSGPQVPFSPWHLPSPGSASDSATLASDYSWSNTSGGERTDRGVSKWSDSEFSSASAGSREGQRRRREQKFWKQMQSMTRGHEVSQTDFREALGLAAGPVVGDARLGRQDLFLEQRAFHHGKGGKGSRRHRPRQTGGS
ncbi:Serine/threonine-protein kinase ppk15 [Durusdinium trenchii]|uniref:Serine/threonine-protein kinase ppk15 n=1 Tax=Durusdinium trenchii TaxID=1381693 RepID=A0ABP0QPG3_9DINO